MTHLRLSSSLVLVALALGCGGTASPVDAALARDTGTDAASTGDAGTGDAGSDAGLAADAGHDASLAADAGLDAGGPATDVALAYRAGTGTLDRAWLGYHRTAGTIDGVYFELNRGGDDACPSTSSPVPAQLISLDGIALGTVPFTRTEADGVMAQFFDFDGTFRSEVAPAVPTALSVEVTALDTTAGTARASVSLTFGTDGTATGTLVATHCDSLDSGT